MYEPFERGHRKNGYCLAAIMPHNDLFRITKCASCALCKIIKSTISNGNAIFLYPKQSTVQQHSCLRGGRYLQQIGRMSLCIVRIRERLPTCCKSKELLQFSNVSSIGFTLLDNIRSERNSSQKARLESNIMLYRYVSSTYFFSWDKYWLFRTVSPV